MRLTTRLVGPRPRAVLAGLTLALLGAPASPVHASSTGTVQTYIVTYKDGASSNDAGALIQGAGGQLIANYSQIGVVVARSDRSDFADRVASGAGVGAAVATGNFATRLSDDQLDSTDSTDPTPPPRRPTGRQRPTAPHG